MVNYFIYAKDYSRSTEDEDHYHINGLKTLEQFKTDVEIIKKEQDSGQDPPPESKVIFLHWGHKCEEVDEETTRRAYLERIGEGRNTLPERIIDWLKVNYDICSENSAIKLLYIITDGMINERSAEECFKSNSCMNYEKVVFHAFNTDLDEIDLSVSSSFFKNRCMVYRNYELHDNIDISVEFDYDKINIENFESEKNNLMSYIRLKFLKNVKSDGRTLKEIDSLKKLRARLFDELSKKTQVNLETKDRNVFIHKFACTDWYQYLTSADGHIKVDIEKTIATLINYLVSENKSYKFDALKFDTKFKKLVEEEPIVDVNFTAEQEIEFPDVILDDEKGIPVIILTNLDLLDKIILHGKDEGEVQPASFVKFKSTMECPLFLVNDKDISESIGYFYTLNVYKQLLANDTKTDPRTRKPFHGGLVLTDTDQFDKYNDYILSATYFNFKKVNFNVGLFYYVLWKNCENKQWMDRNVTEHFKKYTMRRISGTVCKIGLSSLPLDPPENTSLLTALWYCVDLSSHIFKDDAQHFTHERMRMFHGVTHFMIEILKYFEYDLDLKTIERRKELISHVMILKRINKQCQKVYYILKNIFKTVNGFLVSEIEKPHNLYKLNYLKLNPKDMLSDNAIRGAVQLNDYVHLLHFEGSLETPETVDTFPICEKTFRPFFAIDQNKSFYTELGENTKKVVISNDKRNKIKISFEPTDSLEFNKILSVYNLFIKCVIYLEKYPTLSEFVEYIRKKKEFINNKVTIFPSNVYFRIQHVYDRYQKIITNVDVNEFIKVCKTYVDRFERVKAEERVEFNTDYDIKEFISREELMCDKKKKKKKKTNLKKKSYKIILRRHIKTKKIKKYFTNSSFNQKC